MNIEKYVGDWALVTGASSGIGFEFCSQLAAAGINLVMVARREELLRQLADRLIAEHKIQVLVIVQDLSLPDGPRLVYEQTKANNIIIRLLVNNAGIGQWGRFDTASELKYQEMIGLNTAAVVSLCYLFLPNLRAFTESVIINVSSPAAFQPIPYMAVYAGTKSFLQSFSLALHGELLDSGVYVQTLIPGPTETEFDSKAGAYESGLTDWDSPAKVVSTSLSNLDSSKPVVAVAKGTYKQRFFAGLFPYKMVIKEVAKLFTPPN
jgi:hypothetical protein